MRTAVLLSAMVISEAVNKDYRTDGLFFLLIIFVCMDVIEFVKNNFSDK